MNDSKNSPFPFNADVGLRTWMQWKKNFDYYRDKTREEIRRNILFWLNYEQFDRYRKEIPGYN